MNLVPLTLSLLITLPLTLACTDKKAPADPAQHADANVVPGSHDDWCGEHDVPETQCTRCDESLVAAFKATQDWCAEHGLPESHCRKCNPELVLVRPPKPEGQ